MKYTSPLHRVLLAAGALAIVTAPTASAEPEPTGAITAPAESTTSAATPTLDPTTPTRLATTSTGPMPTSTGPTPTSAGPMPTSAVPASTTAGVTPSSSTSAAPTTAAGPGALRVDTGAFVVAGPTQVGGVVPGTVQVTVTDTRPDGIGWTADVKVTDARGTRGNAFSPGPGSYYRAQDTQCSESVGQVPLREDPVVVATAHTACAAATWTSSVGIAVPAEADPDSYTLTITHSVY